MVDLLTTTCFYKQSFIGTQPCLFIYIYSWLLSCNKGRDEYLQTNFCSVRSVAQLCPTLCDAIDCSTPGFPVHHQLPEFAQTHVHQVGDAIQTSYPLLSPSQPAFSLSQHQDLFKWVSSLYQVAKNIGASASASVLPVNIQDWFPFGLTGFIFMQSKGPSRVFCNLTVQKHQFFSAELSL